MRKDFENVILNHGLDAYSECSGIDDLIYRIKNIESHNEWEICCSNSSTYIGAIGISCLGDVRAAFGSDVNSEYKNGKRYIPCPTGEERECSLEHFQKCFQQEAWVSNVRISSIWIQDGVAYTMYNSGKLQKIINLGYPIEIVNGQEDFSIEKFFDSMEEMIKALVELDRVCQGL